MPIMKIASPEYWITTADYRTRRYPMWRASSKLIEAPSTDASTISAGPARVENEPTDALTMLKRRLCVYISIV
jgi:hypothetical protein